MNYRDNTIWVMLPAYNEAENLPSLISAIADSFFTFLPHSRCNIVVVDDGSSDETAMWVTEAKRDARFSENSSVNLVLQQHQKNMGLADALKTGFSYCIEHGAEQDIIVSMDADNSHRPGLIPLMIRRIHEGFDIVIASRYQKGSDIVGLKAYRKWLSVGAGLLYRTIYPIHGVKDYTCGYRAYRYPVLQKAFADDQHFISEKGFACMGDILLKLKQSQPHLLYSEVPMLLRYDSKLGQSKMAVATTVKDTLRLLLKRRMHPGKVD